MTHRRVIITSTAQHPGPVPDEIRDGAEVWTVNLGGWVHPYAERTYFMDDPAAFRELSGQTFADYINGLTDGGLTVYAREVWPDMPGVTKLDVDGIAERLGIDYFTSTVAYMVAHAIDEGVDAIDFWGCYHWEGMAEYTQQKPCLEAWCGYAIARGIAVRFLGGTMLMQPYPGQVKRYGFEPENHILMGNKIAQSGNNIAAMVELRALMEPIA